MNELTPNYIRAVLCTIITGITSLGMLLSAATGDVFSTCVFAMLVVANLACSCYFWERVPRRLR